MIFPSHGAAVAFMVRVLAKQATPKSPGQVVSKKNGPHYTFTHQASRSDPLKFKPKAPARQRIASNEITDELADALDIKAALDEADGGEGLLRDYLVKRRSARQFHSGQRPRIYEAKEKFCDLLCCKGLLAGPRKTCLSYRHQKCSQYPREIGSL